MTTLATKGNVEVEPHSGVSRRRPLKGFMIGGNMIGLPKGIRGIIGNKIIPCLSLLLWFLLSGQIGLALSGITHGVLSSQIHGC
jgi:hypothetical protein